LQVLVQLNQRACDDVQEAAKDLLYDKAFKKAKGEKVKDDVNKIKKTIKRKQSSKVKSQQEWYESSTYSTRSSLLVSLSVSLWRNSMPLHL
jgi:CRISPR/Cas system CMR subunit Cmr6 (Cas7 group RAMP superfamily)